MLSYQHFVVPDSFLYVFNAGLLSTGDGVQSSQAYDGEQEILQHSHTILCQVNLRMKLDTIQLHFFIDYTW